MNISDNRTPWMLIMAVCLAGLPGKPLAAQQRWPVPRMEKEIVFDGMPDEDAWSGIKPFPMFTMFPVAGLEPVQASDIRMGYNDEYLYVGARLFVTDPGLLCKFGKKRDLQSAYTDWFGVSLDTYNDKENALQFFTNPNGIRWDAALLEDGVARGENPPINMNWNTFWEVKTSSDAEGWYVEMLIPVSSLRFKGDSDTTVMGLTLTRAVPAANEQYIFPKTPYNWGRDSYRKPSQFAELGFHGLKSKRPLYVTPYLLSGVKQYNTLNETGTAYEYGSDFALEPGLDIKYGISPNTTLDLTVNTDFAQVEADDQQFNLTRLNLLYEEKRAFFLERSSIFDFEMGGSSLFYSRRIGLHEGNPVRIWGGARLNSRVKDWDIGFLDMQTASFEDQPSENFGVFRVKKRVLNKNSYAGGMFTSRLGVDGSYNLAYGLDGVVRMFGDDYLIFRWAQTFRDSAVNNLLSMDPARLFVQWERRSREGFSYLISGVYSGTAFDPGVGFELFQDYWLTQQDLRYTWISPDQSKMQSHSLMLRQYNSNNVADGRLLMYYLGPTWEFTTKNRWSGSVNVHFKKDILYEPFQILDLVSVPAGDYNYLESEWMLTTPITKPVIAIIKFEGGRYFDGAKASPSIEPTLNIGSSLELAGLYRYDYVIFALRNQVLKNHIAGIRGLYMFSTKISLSAFVQYNTAINKVISNVRFRYNPREGTDLYLVFNEGRNTLPDRMIPELPVYDQRNFTVKYTYTFQMQR